MNTNHYINLFQNAFNPVNQTSFAQNHLELKVGVWLNSVVLKVQKKSWQNPNRAPFESGIFFSVWINDESIAKGKLYYNIHALKLRELSAYKIKSRDFAEAFRLRFKPFEHAWPNVSAAFGPLTLMEGWVKYDADHMSDSVADITNRFLLVQHIIDNLLADRKK